ncbi:MAG TPA: head GIN domain-containing protein [Hanamia sp.]|nr:head GIN domain-containing protein [Hanamia sp.]
MKNFIIMFVGAMCIVSCNSISGNGNIKSEDRTIPDIHGVRTSGSIDIEIKEGSSYSLVVEDDENLLPYIVTDVSDGVLNIHYKDNYSINDDHAKVTITAPRLDKISTSGSGDIQGSGTIRNSSEIEFNLSGSGNIEAAVDAPSIKVTGSGSGNIELSGRTKNFDCRVSGSGDISCAGLQSENANIKISGSGNAHVFASVSLKASTSGSGDVFYSGNPQTPEIHTSGSGTVQRQP